jgi:hypothetical protein
MNIRWGRVVLLALALEVVLFATLLPIQPLLSPRAWLVAVGIGAVVFSYAAGWLAGRGLTTGAALNGFLVARDRIYPAPSSSGQLISSR